MKYFVRVGGHGMFPKLKLERVSYEQFDFKMFALLKPFKLSQFSVVLGPTILLNLKLYN